MGLQGAAAGLDFSAMMLSVARAAPTYGGPPIEWTEGDAANLPYADESFDLVIIQQGLQFFPDRSRSAREIHRVLKPGGRLAAAVWQGTDVHPIFRSLFDLVAQRLDVPFNAVALPFSLGSADELEAYVKLGGFDHVDVTPRELELEFRSPSRFAQLSVVGAAAAIPAFGEMDAEMRAAVGEDVSQELAPTLEPHVVGDILNMHTAVNIAIAIK